MENQLIKWLETEQAKSTMSATRIPLAKVEHPWGFIDGDYQRITQDFFKVTGVKIANALTREVSSWTQAILEELGGKGIVALIQETTHGKLLLTAKPEPGNKAKGCTLLAASVQASVANIEQKHGGTKSPLASLLDHPNLCLVHESEQPEDGGRFFHKSNMFRLYTIQSVEVFDKAIEEVKNADPKHGEILLPSIWATKKEINGALLEGLCNQHLRSAMSVLDSYNDEH